MQVATVLCLVLCFLVSGALLEQTEVVEPATSSQQLESSDEALLSDEVSIAKEEKYETSSILQILLDILPLDAYAAKILSQIQNSTQTEVNASTQHNKTSTSKPQTTELPNNRLLSDPDIIYGIPDTSIPSSSSASSSASTSPTLSQLSNVRDKFNYASMDCGANVLSVNRDAKDATSILVGSKDRYMLNPCGVSKRFVVLELCEEIGIQILALANYEFFSSMLKGFQVFGTNRYPAQQWTPLGNFSAQNARRLQYFVLPAPLWFKYIRIQFDTHYGDEYYCPISELRVHGTTVAEDITLQMERDNLEISELTNALRSPFRSYQPPVQPDLKAISSNYHPPIHRHAAEPDDDDEDDPIDRSKDWDSFLSDTGKLLKGLEDTFKQSFQRIRNGIEENLYKHEAHVIDEYVCACDPEDGDCECSLEYDSEEIKHHINDANLHPSDVTSQPESPQTLPAPEQLHDPNPPQTQHLKTQIKINNDNTDTTFTGKEEPPDISKDLPPSDQPHAAPSNTANALPNIILQHTTNTLRLQTVSISPSATAPPAEIQPFPVEDTTGDGSVDDRASQHTEHGDAATPREALDDTPTDTATKQPGGEIPSITEPVLKVLDGAVDEDTIYMDNQTLGDRAEQPELSTDWAPAYTETVRASNEKLNDEATQQNSEEDNKQPTSASDTNTYIERCDTDTIPNNRQSSVDQRDDICYNNLTSLSTTQQDDHPCKIVTPPPPSPAPSTHPHPEASLPPTEPPSTTTPHDADMPPAPKSPRKRPRNPTNAHEPEPISGAYSTHLGIALGSTPQNIFKTLINRIKTLEINQSIAAVYLADLTTFYAEAFSKMSHMFARLETANSNLVDLVQNSTKKLIAKQKHLAEEVEELRAERTHTQSNISVLAREIHILSETTMLLKTQLETQQWINIFAAGAVGALVVCVIWRSSGTTTTNNNSNSSGTNTKYKPRTSPPILKASRSLNILNIPDYDKPITPRRRRRHSIGHSLSPSWRSRRLSFHEESESDGNSDWEMDADDEISNKYFKNKDQGVMDDDLTSSSSKQSENKAQGGRGEGGGGGGRGGLTDRVLPYLMRKSASTTTMDTKYQPDLLRFLFM